MTIGKDRNILLDVTPPALRSLTIEGKLSFSNDKDLGLTTEWIYLPGGELDIGSEAQPHTAKATITLTDNVKDENINTMGDRGIMLLNGTLSLHGDRKNSWTKLSATAKAGNEKIQVLDASGWRKGDVIVLASTDFNPRQAEERTITAISGNALTLDKPLAYMHFGKITDGVDERGEVGMLTRNIKIQASEDAEKTYFGGHIMAMAGRQMYLSGIELRPHGPEHASGPLSRPLARPGRRQGPVYQERLDPRHLQPLRDGARHEQPAGKQRHQHRRPLLLPRRRDRARQRIHPQPGDPDQVSSDKDCVPVNLAANGEINGDRAAIRKESFSGKNTLLPSDNTVSSFWITNPDNSFIDNVAAGSDETGFWLSLPEHPQGAFKDSEASKTIWPRRTPMRAFKGNVAHSNFDGFMFDRNIYPDNTFGLATIPFLPLANPADLDSDVVETHFENLTSYKNRNGGLWSRGDLFIFSNAKFADNAIGMTSAAGDIGSERFKARLVDLADRGRDRERGQPRHPGGKRLTAAACPRPVSPTSRSAAMNIMIIAMMW